MVIPYQKAARYQQKTARGVRCMICPHLCVIQEGKTGKCGTRKNLQGTLYSIVYGTPCSVHIDPIEKKPLLHFYPGSLAFSIATSGCNLSCLNCQNWTISQAAAMNSPYRELMPAQVVEEALRNHCLSIAYTYTEPLTFFEYTLDTAIIAREKGIRNVLVSAGFVQEAPLRELAPYIDAANIDLKAFSDDIYKELNGGRLAPVLRTLQILKESHTWLEITNLLIPGWNDNPQMISDMCKWLVVNDFEDTPLHFSRFFPTYKLMDVSPTPVKLLHDARQIAREEGMRYVYIGNVAGDNENTACHACGRTVIQRKAYNVLKNILHSGKCGYCGETIPGHWSHE